MVESIISKSSTIDKKAVMSVTQLTNYIRQKLSTDAKLSQVYVQGEITNVAKPDSGHIYFDIKDESSIISCAFFRNDNKNLEFEIEDGQESIIVGSVSIYERRSTYRIVVAKIYPVGEGAPYLKFKQTKEKLEKEGLFAKEHKRELPYVPNAIGLICSVDGNAYHDIIHVLKTRFPHVTLTALDCAMQGETASTEISQGINLFNRLNNVDAIIIARGGGSFEDLMCFNDEALAITIFKSKIPVVTGIGHETDYTIADFVADERAPTPSIAGKVVVPEAKELKARINSLKVRLENGYKNYTTLKKAKKREKEVVRYRSSLLVAFVVLLILLIILAVIILGR